MPAQDPAEELVDIVDETGRVIAVTTRRHMRQHRLPHRCTWVLVFDPAGRLFVHLRSPTKDLLPLHWDVTVGGVSLAGEEFDRGAVRELQEELGISAQPERLFEFRFPQERPYAIGVVYRLTHPGPFSLQPEEIVCGEFLSWEDLTARVREQPFCAEGLAILDAYRRWSGCGD
jgi:isopentenyldiphosphate isomerase